MPRCYICNYCPETNMIDEDELFENTEYFESHGGYMWQSDPLDTVSYLNAKMRVDEEGRDVCKACDGVSQSNLQELEGCANRILKGLDLNVPKYKRHPVLVRSEQRDEQKITLPATAAPLMEEIEWEKSLEHILNAPTEPSVDQQTEQQSTKTESTALHAKAALKERV